MIIKDQKRLTYTETLILCYLLWRWLANNPKCRHKAEAPIWLYTETTENWCFCCEYVKQQIDTDIVPEKDVCWLCPLYPIWRKGRKLRDTYGLGCQCELWSKSPWKLWNNPITTIEDRAKAAGAIADGCLILLGEDIDGQ